MISVDYHMSPYDIIASYVTLHYTKHVIAEYATLYYINYITLCQIVLCDIE